MGLLPYGADEPSGEVEDEASADLGLTLRVFTPTFFALTTFVVCLIMVTTLSGHMSSLAQDYGYSAQAGALMLSACMVGNVVSKFARGFGVPAVPSLTRARPPLGEEATKLGVRTVCNAAWRQPLRRRPAFHPLQPHSILTQALIQDDSTMSKGLSE